MDSRQLIAAILDSDDDAAALGALATWRRSGCQGEPEDASRWRCACPGLNLGCAPCLDCGMTAPIRPLDPVDTTLTGSENVRDSGGLA